jgi:hypothetical protein
MDDFFNNIVVYLPIIFIVLFRILGARKKPAEKEAPLVEAEAEPVAPPRKKPPKRPPAPRSGVPEPEPAFALAPVSRAEVAPKRAFPENLGYLPALKRAVVFAEIMGPPKALSGGRGFELPGGAS